MEMEAEINTAENISPPMKTVEDSKHDVPKKKSKGHRCYFCGQRFLDKNKLRKHISVHKDRDYFCDVCGKAFSTSWGLSKHMKIHTGERPFQCEFCGKAFIQKCTLQFHIKALHSDKAHPRCKSCGRRIKSQNQAQCWLCRYHGREILDDVQASNVHESLENMIINLKKPQNLEPSSSQTENAVNADNIVCNLQDIDNTNKVNSSESYIFSYKNSPEFKKCMTNSEPVCAVFTCHQCGQKFEESFLMQQHLLVHTDLLPYVCQKCGKDFKTDSYLRQHMISHKEDRPYVCKTCKSAFKSMACLRQHLVSHSEERPYVCKECGSAFKAMQSLKTHIMVHNKVKPLSCKTCGKAFTFLGNLQRHFRVHTGERPYQCKHCEKKFSQSNGLKAHEQTHIKPEKSVEESLCTVCGKKFRSFSNFKKHLLLHGQSYNAV